MLKIHHSVQFFCKQTDTTTAVITKYQPKPKSVFEQNHIKIQKMQPVQLTMIGMKYFCTVAIVNTSQHCPNGLNIITHQQWIDIVDQCHCPDSVSSKTNEDTWHAVIQLDLNAANDNTGCCQAIALSTGQKNSDKTEIHTRWSHFHHSDIIHTWSGLRSMKRKDFAESVRAASESRRAFQTCWPYQPASPAIQW